LSLGGEQPPVSASTEAGLPRRYAARNDMVQFYTRSRPL